MNTCVLTVSVLQSMMMVLPDKKLLKSCPKMQLQLSLFNNREKSQRFKTSIRELSELVNFNETFCFLNIEKSNHILV
jgi:hypothetical protein